MNPTTFALCYKNEKPKNGRQCLPLDSFVSRSTQGQPASTKNAARCRGLMTKVNVNTMKPMHNNNKSKLYPDPLKTLVLTTSPPKGQLYFLFIFFQILILKFFVCNISRSTSSSTRTMLKEVTNDCCSFDEHIQH